MKKLKKIFWKILILQLFFYNNVLVHEVNYMKLYFNHLVALGNFIYIKTFGVEMEPSVVGMFKNTTLTLMGGIIGSCVLLFVTTTAGRLLGPVEYGKITLLVTLSQIIILFLLFGLDTTSLREITLAQNNTDKKLQASSCIGIFLCLSVIVGTVFF